MSESRSAPLPPSDPAPVEEPLHAAPPRSAPTQAPAAPPMKTEPLPERRRRVIFPTFEYGAAVAVPWQLEDRGAAPTAAVVEPIAREELIAIGRQGVLLIEVNAEKVGPSICIAMVGTVRFCPSDGRELRVAFDGPDVARGVDVAEAMEKLREQVTVHVRTMLEG